MQTKAVILVNKFGMKGSLIWIVLLNSCHFTMY